ncbi:MAG: Do family serine endopeptidase [Rhodospirillaceae bacterium]|nr:Do family serine endopeptidase [Rhodospirillaceae bacterium]
MQKTFRQTRFYIITLLVSFVSIAGMQIPAPAHSAAAPESFAELADKLLPAVVNISTTQVIENRAPQEMPQFPPGSPFEDFFKEFFDRNQPGGQQFGKRPQKRLATSLGSGFVIDYKSNGDTFIVTNNHVVQDADEVNAILQDGTRLEAEIVGRDAKTDIAVLKVKSNSKLSSVGFGDSDVARVGDWVLAIGNPFGLGGTVTAGIISARGRDINAGPYDNFIQTDASINRGNSGGPMFNMKGEVIGINTAIFSPSGGSVGIGFAIPSNAAKLVIDQLIKNGQVSRGWLGVNIQEVTDPIAEALNLKKPIGALVSNVTEGSPAADGGIKPRDVIIEFDGKAVNEMRHLPRMVAATPVNKNVKVKVWRDGKEKILNLKIGKLDEKVAEVPAVNKSEKPTTGEVDVQKLGLTLSSLTPDLIERFGLGSDTKGVVVVDTDPDGSAARERIRPGDVIHEVSQQKVSTPDEVSKIVDKAASDKKHTVLLLVEGQSGFRFVAPTID